MASNQYPFSRWIKIDLLSYWRTWLTEGPSDNGKLPHGLYRYKWVTAYLVNIILLIFETLPHLLASVTVDYSNKIKGIHVQCCLHYNPHRNSSLFPPTICFEEVTLCINWPVFNCSAFTTASCVCVHCPVKVFKWKKHCRTVDCIGEMYRWPVSIKQYLSHL